MRPVLDGWGFLRACRQEGPVRQHAVLVIAACRQLAEAGRIELGVDQFLRKPL